MNRAEFLNNLIVKYPNFFNEEDKTNAWMQDYKSVLPLEADYQRINKAILFEYTSTQYPPTPAWLYQKWLEIKREEEGRKKYEPPVRDGVPPPPHVVEMMKEFRAKQKIRSQLMQQH